MAMEIKIVTARSPLGALDAAFPHWKIDAVMQIPTDGYKIWAAHLGDVTLLAWENGDHEDGTKNYICKALSW
jgi:hypothetical protein